MRHVAIILGILLMASPFCGAQDAPEEDGHEWQIWAGGGHSVPGGTKTRHTGVFQAGLRYGWILTGPHLNGFVRGRFEYAIDAIPLFLVFQPANTAYGVTFNPAVLKWNFERHGRFSPYVELTGGALFTNHTVPTRTNTVNFTPQGALGMHILGEKHNVAVEVRFLHISNAGLARPNPGINTVQFRFGFGQFLRPRKP